MSITKKCLVISQRRYSGWVLDALWKESSQALNFKPKSLYLTRNDIFNYWLSLRFLFSGYRWNRVLAIHGSSLNFLSNIGLLQRIQHLNVILTHINSKEELLSLVNFYKEYPYLRFLTMNGSVASSLHQEGIGKGSLDIVYGAVDRSIYFPANKNILGDYVLIGGECKPRKSPGKIAEVIRRNSDIHFTFEHSSWLKEMRNVSPLVGNFNVWNTQKLSRGDLYRNASALLTLSALEGGPIPVLQALASGTPVLSSDVGFVREVVTDGFGRVINLDLTIREISVLLKEVASMKKIVSTQDGLEGKFSWQELGQKLFTFAD